VAPRTLARCFHRRCARAGGADYQLAGRSMSRFIFLVASLILVAIVALGFRALGDRNLVGTDRQPRQIKSSQVVPSP